MASISIWGVVHRDHCGHDHDHRHSPWVSKVEPLSRPRWRSKGAPRPRMTQPRAGFTSSPAIKALRYESLRICGARALRRNSVWLTVWFGDAGGARGGGVDAVSKKSLGLNR